MDTRFLAPIPNDDLFSERCWQAVIHRDARADGEFVYAVRTTGVYCRPSCPSRAARRQNVTFFRSGELAAAAGYRPCKRCRPDAPSQQQARATLVRQACARIERSATPPTLAQLAQQAGMSPYHFQRVFKAVAGISPKAYHKALQARRMTVALQSAPSVTAAIHDAGFNSSGRFYETAPARLGMSPGSYRKGGVNEHIRYAVEPCALGWIIVAAGKGYAPSSLAMRRRRWPNAFGAGFRRPGSSPPTTSSHTGSARCWAISNSREAYWICRWTCRERYFSSASGKPCGRSRQGRPPATAKSPPASASRRRIVPWPMPAPAIPWRSPFPATAPCVPTAASPATAGASCANANCCGGKMKNDPANHSANRPNPPVLCSRHKKNRGRGPCSECKARLPAQRLTGPSPRLRTGLAAISSSLRALMT